MKPHHVGIVVRDMEAALGELQHALGGARVAGRGIDPRQAAEITLAYSAGGQLIELLHPTSDDSPIASALSHGGGLHHLCYGVADVRATAGAVRDAGGILVVEPVAAVAFGGLEVAFAYFRHLGLVEYVDERAEEPFFQPRPTVP